MLGDESVLGVALTELENAYEALRQIQERIDTTVCTVVAQNRALSVTANGHGELTAFHFRGDTYRTLAPAELAETILRTAAEARREAQAQARDGSDFSLPGALPDFREISSSDGAGMSVESVAEKMMISLTDQLFSAGRPATPGHGEDDRGE